MKKTTLSLGMHDKLFKRARTMYQIEHRICDLLMTKGFLRIETPTLEHFEVFSDVVDNGNYNFFDKNGDLVSLRPDINSQIGRVIASTQVQADPHPARPDLLFAPLGVEQGRAAGVQGVDVNSPI